MTDVSAQVVALEDRISRRALEPLTKLFEEKGRLEAEDVVAAAKPPKSPLHGFFTWDDGEAAKQWRLEEARQLIGRVKIVHVVAPELPPVRVRAFTSVLHEGERTFMPTRMALTSHHDQVMEQALRDIEVMRRRYAALVDFDEVLRRALGQAAA